MIEKSGILSSNETWSGTIMVTGDLEIAPGITLAVEPGTTILFRPRADYISKCRKVLFPWIYLQMQPVISTGMDDERCHIIVRGTIRARGTTDNPIIIGNEGWGGGIVVSSDRIAEMSGCIIRHARVAVISVGGEGIRFSGNRLEHNTCGVLVGDTSCIQGNTVSDVDTGVIISDYFMVGDVEVGGNTIEDCRRFGMRVVDSVRLDCAGGAIRIDGNRIGRSPIAIQVCVCRTLQILRNRISECDVAINIAVSRTLAIAENTLEQVRLGIYLEQVTDVAINDNDLRCRETAVIANKDIENFGACRNRITGTRAAFDCRDCKSASLDGNIVENGGNGFSFQGNCSAMVARNRFIGLGGSAVICRGICSVSARENRYERVGKGIECGEESRMQAQEEEMAGASCGIDISGMGRCVAAAVRIDSGGGVGIRCSESGSLSMAGGAVGGLCAVRGADAAELNIEGTVLTAKQQVLSAADQSRWTVGKATIDGGSGSGAGMDLKGRAEVQAKGCAIGGVSRGVVCEGESSLGMDECKVSGRDVGVQVCDMSCCEIHGTDIEGGGNGIQAAGGATVTVQDGALRGDCGVDAGDAGEISIYGVAIAGSRRGLFISGQCRCTVSGSTITGSAEAAVGIESRDSAEVTVGGSGIQDVSRGITCEDDSGIQMKDCTILAVNAGIFVGDTARMTTEAATVRSAAGVGIECGESGSVQVRNGSIGGAVGIRGGDAAEMDVREVRIESGETGLECAGQSRWVIHESTIDGAGGRGSGMECSDGAEVAANRVTVGGVARAVIGGDSSLLRLSGCSIAGKGSGIYVSGASSLQSDGTDIDGGEGTGLRCDENSSVRLAGGSVRGASGMEGAGTSTVEASAVRIVAESKGIFCAVHSSWKVTGAIIAAGRVGVDASDMSRCDLAAAFIDAPAGVGVKCGDGAAVAAAGGRIAGFIGIEGGDACEIAVSDVVIAVRTRGIGCAGQCRCTVSGVTFAGPGDDAGTAIEIRGNAEARVTRVSVEQFRQGFSCNEDSTLLLEGSRIRGGQLCVDVADTSACTLEGNDFSSPGTGIRISESGSARLKGGSVDGARGIDGGGIGEIQIEDVRITGGLKCGLQSRWNITNASIRCGGTGTAVDITDMSRCEITDSAIDSECGIAVQCSDGASARIVNGSVAGGEGVCGDDVSEIGLEQVHVSAGGRGVACLSQSRCAVTGGVIEGRAGGKAAIGVQCVASAEFSARDTGILTVLRGVVCTGGSTAVLENCTVTAADSGVDVADISRLSGIGMVITSAGPGLRFSESVSVQLKGGSIDGAPALDGGGISEIRIDGVRITGGKQGMKCGMQSRWNVVNAVVRCSGIGVEVSGMADCTLGSSAVESTAEMGIRCSEGGTVSVTGSTISGVGGIESSDTAGVMVSGTSISGARRGVWCSGESRLTVGSSVIASEGGVAIHGCDGGLVKVTAGEIVGNDGVECGDLCETAIESARIVFRERGIWCSDQSRIDLRDSDIEGAVPGEGTGIECHDGAAATVHGGTITGAARGISCEDESTVSLGNSTVEGSESGIAVTDMGRVACESAAVASAEGAALRCSESGAATMAGGSLRGVRGVFGRDVAEIKIRDLRVIGAQQGAACFGQSRLSAEAVTIAGEDAAVTAGIESHDDAEVAVRGGILENLLKGVVSADRSTVLLSGAHISSDAECLECGDITRIDVDESQLRSRGGAGMLLSMGASCRARRTDIAGRSGVVLGDQSQLDLSDSTIHFLDRGLEFGGSSAGRVETTVIQGGGEGESIAVDIIESAEATLRRNRIENADIGVRYDPRREVTLENNSVTARRVPYQSQYSGDNEIRDIELQRLVNLLDREEARRAGKIMNRVRSFVLATRLNPVLGPLYRSVYGMAIRAARRSLGRISGVTALYLRRGLLKEDWIPGASDIDFYLVIDELDAAAEMALLRRLWRSYGRLKKFFPMLGELQIGTAAETASYLAASAIRGRDESWKPLIGEKPATDGRVPAKEEIVAGLFSEILISWRNITDVCFKQRPGHLRRLSFAKAFIDIVKNAALLDEGRIKRYPGRRQALAAARAGARDPKACSIMDRIDAVWNRNEELPEQAYGEAYGFLFTLIDLSFDRALGSMVQKNVAESSLSTDCAASPRPDDDPVKLAKWERICSLVYSMGEGDVEGMIIDSPGLLYLVMNRKAPENAGFADRLKNILDCTRALTPLQNTPSMVLTPAMYQALCLSLHLESPAAFFRLSDRRGLTLAAMGGEECLQSNISRRRFVGPEPDAYRRLAREALALLSVSLRMMGHTMPFSNRHAVIYLVTRILGLQLAYEKGIIIPLFAEGTAARYRQEYPERGEFVDRLAARFLNRSSAEVNAASPRALFAEIYPFLRDILSKIDLKTKEGSS